MDIVVRKRNPWIDSLKAFAIYLVIVGHVLSNCMTNGAELRVTGIIYFIHIPLFLVISGILVKDKHIDCAFWIGLIKRFFVPYTVWTIVLTTFYLGVSHLIRDGIVANLNTYFGNWCHSFLWFIKAYLVSIILWQLLQKLSCVSRLVLGTALLFGINLLVQKCSALSEIASLSLYSYTLFGAGACVKKILNKINLYVVVLLVLCFLLCLPLATHEHNYFECSFSHMLRHGDWYVFIIRFVAGLSLSIALIKMGNICQITPPGWRNIGQNTLQIYMLQSLLVEAILNRIIHLSNSIYGVFEAFLLSLFITIVCFEIIKVTSQCKIIKILFWGL